MGQWSRDSYLMDLNFYGNLDTFSNGTIVGELGEDIERRFGEKLKTNLAEIVRNSFGFAGSPQFLYEGDFYDGAVSGLITNDEMRDWAKERHAKDYADPLMYLFALAVYTKTLAKSSGILEQRGEYVSLAG